MDVWVWDICPIYKYLIEKKPLLFGKLLEISLNTDTGKQFCEELTSHYFLFHSILGAGLAVFLIPLADTWLLLGCSSAAYGLCLGCWYLLMPVLLADVFGTERISSSYGLVRMFQSVGAISVPPLAGYLRDLTGGYEICFYCMGVCMILGTLPLLFLSSFIRNNDSSTPEESDVSTIS